jgi:hypothetical protein
MSAPANLETLSESQWQSLVIEAAGFHGWWHIHHRNALGNPMWVDLLLLRSDRFILLELKSMKGKVTLHQQALHDTLSGFGVPVYVLRPCEDDWNRLQALLR